MLNIKQKTDELPKMIICLIVKNEGGIIMETLESICKYVNYYVINDTGSTDNTVEIITNFFDKKGIPGEIFCHEFRTCKCHPIEYKRYSFFHFGWNRTYAFQMCKSKSQYIWVIDADDLVVGELDFSNLKEDCYMLTYGKGFTYQRMQIFKNDPTYNWGYEGALHEYPICDKPNFTKALLPGDYYIDSRRLGARSQDPKKYLRDAEVFEELLLENPDNERSMFYCAQSYFDYGDHNNAIKWYRKRIEIGRWHEEVFYSYYRIGMAMEHLNYPWKDIEKAYLDCYNFCKQRAEPLYNIAKHYRLEENYENSYKYAKMAQKINYPEKCTLFIYKELYDYKIADELAISAFSLGKYMESFSINKKLIEENKIYPDDIERIKNNLKFSEQKLNEKNKKMTCFYFGNEYINKDNPVINIINSISKYNKIIIIGNHVDIYNINYVIGTVNNFKFLENIKVDYLILYNSLNYFYDKIKINASQIILLQNDSSFKRILKNGMHLQIYNNNYLNKILGQINQIVAMEEKIKNKISNDYKIFDDSISFIDKKSNLTYYKLLEDNKNKYISKSLIENDTNGFIYAEPKNISFLKENKCIYDFSKTLLSNFYKEIMEEMPNMPEHYYKLAQIDMEFSDYHNSLLNLENALKLIKDNDNYLNYKDIILIFKSTILNKLTKYQESYILADEVLKRDLLPESLRISSEEFRDKNIDYIKDNYLLCSKNKINKIITSLQNKKNKKIMLSITTCKRFDLFEKTINSFINCCLDLNLIDIWLCVDDNSSIVDRNKMKKNYPFFEYIMKDESQKGHCVSMNIILETALKYNVDYILHMEDDWHYIQKRNFISESIKILNDDKKIGQVLFNRNYHEIEPFKRPIKGGIIKKIKTGGRYILHEHYDTNSKEYNNFIQKYKNCSTVGYWPHFSFRPSLLKVSMLKEVGSFFNTGHFEMEYAKEYNARGYKSAFLDTFACIHIGKKTWETSVKNSYHLNETNQFSLKNDILSIYIISDNKNINIWKNFKETSKHIFPSYTRFLPRNVLHLDDYEKKIFINNEFNFSRNIIDKIMLHIDLFKQTKSNYMLFLRDCVEFKDNNKETFDKIIKLTNENYDFIILDNNDNDHNKDNNEIKLLKSNEKLNLDSINGYLISKECINKILEYIQNNCIKNMNYLDNIKNINYYKLDYQFYKINKENNEEINPESVEEIYQKLEGFTFYSQMDSFGGDIGYYGNKTLTELETICNKENCIGFNTLGWIKKEIKPVNEFIYLPNSKKFSDGIYVKI